jgi:aryl-alcohol dehydrogenase-like predicted oxidoreductase
MASMQKFMEDAGMKQPMVVGTWSWGDKYFGDFDEAEMYPKIKEAFEFAVNKGVTMFDTAEMYGNGKSEELLGKVIKETHDDHVVQIATKFIPTPTLIRSHNLIEHFEQSRDRLGQPVTVYFIHGMMASMRSVETWCEMLIELAKKHDIKHVGVSNFSIDQLERAHKTLGKAGIKLAVQQIEYSLCRRCPEQGMLAKCEELGVAVWAYSSLAQGRLTGKYSKENPPPSNRRFGNVDLDALDELVGELKKVAKEVGPNVTPSQVALRWIIQKNVIPIAGFRELKHAKDNLGALDIKLTDKQMSLLDEKSESCQANPSLFARMWQRG